MDCKKYTEVAADLVIVGVSTADAIMVEAFAMVADTVMVFGTGGGQVEATMMAITGVMVTTLEAVMAIATTDFAAAVTTTDKPSAS